MMGNFYFLSELSLPIAQRKIKGYGVHSLSSQQCCSLKHNKRQ